MGFAEAKAVEAEAKAAEADKAREAAKGAAELTVRSVADLEARCDALQAETEALREEKSALIAEAAKTAGHLNHKQKIQYVAKLKSENDELKQQLKQLAVGKENSNRRPARAGLA